MGELRAGRTRTAVVAVMGSMFDIILLGPYLFFGFRRVHHRRGTCCIMGSGSDDQGLLICSYLRLISLERV